MANSFLHSELLVSFDLRMDLIDVDSTVFVNTNFDVVMVARPSESAVYNDGLLVLSSVSCRVGSLDGLLHILHGACYARSATGHACAIPAMNDHICPICGKSKDSTKATFQYRRFGHAEPPKPVRCNCRSPDDKLNTTTTKVRSITSITTTMLNTTMELLSHPSPSMVMIEVVYDRLTTEVEIRVDFKLAKIVCVKMRDGPFLCDMKWVIKETGCAWCVWWTGSDSNINVGLR